MRKLASSLALLVMNIGLPNAATAAFVGPYDLSNWTFTKALNTSDAHVDLSQAPNSFTLYGSNSGTGRTSNDYFSIKVPSDQSTLSTGITFPGPGVQSSPIFSYTATLESINISFDWAYKTDDPDGPSFDTLVCAPVCSGFNPNGPSIQSGHVNFTISDSLLWKMTEVKNPYDGKIYDFSSPHLVNNISGVG